MFGFNVPAKFTTEKGSKYIVTNNGVQRFKKVTDADGHVEDKGEHGGEGKNIFYVAEADRESLRGLGDKNPRVTPNGPEEAYLLYGPDDGRKSILMHRNPALSMRPYDVFLEPDGRFSVQSRRHVGHKIVHID